MKKFRCIKPFPGYIVGEYYLEDIVMSDDEFTRMVDDYDLGTDFDDKEMEEYFVAVEMEEPEGSTVKGIVWATLITIAAITLYLALTWRS